MRKLFNLANKWIAQLTKFITHVLQNWIIVLKDKKIFKKAVSLGGFFQCSIYMFLGHDNCFWKINLEILLNHIMNNFQIKHGQCDSIIFTKIYFFWNISVIIRTLLCWKQDSLLLTGPGIYSQIYQGATCPTVLIY